MNDLTLERLRFGLQNEPHPHKRIALLESLAEGLGPLRGELAEALIVETLWNDRNCIVRHEAAFILGKLFGRGDIPGKRAVIALSRSAVSDNSIVVRHESTESLGWFPYPSTLELLETLKSDSHPEVAETAKLSIMRLKSDSVEIQK